MAKTLPASFGEVDPSEFARAGTSIVFDGSERGWRGIARDQHWLLANRVTPHLHGWWPAGAYSRGGGGAATGRSIRETSVGVYVDRLECRITPRLHVPRLRVWCNAATDGGTGNVRVSIGATNLTFGFAGLDARSNEQQGTLAVTGGTPPATDLVVVRMQVPAAAAAWIDLRWLTISDDALLLADLP